MEPPGGVRATFAQGGSIHAQLESWSADGVALRNLEFGPAKFNLSLLAAVQFLREEGNRFVSDYKVRLACDAKNSQSLKALTQMLYVDSAENPPFSRMRDQVVQKASNLETSRTDYTRLLEAEGKNSL